MKTRIWRSALPSKRSLALGLSLTLGLTVLALWYGLPPEFWIDQTLLTRPKESVRVVDRHGQTLGLARVDGIDRSWVDLAQISPHLVQAVVAAEDLRFRDHGGIDYWALGRATVTNLLPGNRWSGASTITQQVVKLTHGRPAGLGSKGLEMLRATALEKLLTKDAILEQYLNRLPFGDQIVGVGRASQEYFGHPAAELTLAEAALLAGIPQAPSVTEPRRHLARAMGRRSWILKRMLQAKLIDARAFEQASQEIPVIRGDPPRPREALRWVESALREWQAGTIDRDGSVLRTSLDLELQHRVEATMRGAVEQFEGRGVTNGAAIVVANSTGEILAYVGAARPGLEVPGGSLDLLRRPRQPGSTLKPFVYELLFENGGTAATVLSDISLPMSGAQGSQFEAQDYDGRERGPVRARVALAASLNLAALDAATRVGSESILRRLRQLGIGRLKRAEHYGAAVVLGGLDVTPLELARSYVTLARGGSRIPLSLVPKSALASGPQLMQKEACSVITDILSDSRIREESFGRRLGNQRYALKTGTSSGWRDAWAAVTTEQLTVVVWLGDPGRHPLHAVSGFEAAAPAAVHILDQSLERWPSLGVVNAPSGKTSLAPLEICADSGLLPGPHCRHTVREWFAGGTLPRQTCAAHTPQGGLLLPGKYADWIERTHSAAAVDAAPPLNGAMAVPVIQQPSDGSRLLIDPAGGRDQIRLRATVAGQTEDDVIWNIDGQTLGGSLWRAVPGSHVLVASWRGQPSSPAHVEITTREANALP